MHRDTVNPYLVLHLERRELERALLGGRVKPYVATHELRDLRVERRLRTFRRGEDANATLKAAERRLSWFPAADSTNLEN